MKIVRVILFFGFLGFVTDSGAKKNPPKAAVEKFPLEKFITARTVIIFSPHPDDDVLGCGGACLTHTESGARVVIVYMTSGEATAGKKGPDYLMRVREKEAKAAAQKLGVSEQVFLREPDGKLRLSPINSEKIARLIREIQPDLIYVPHSEDGHGDHKETYKIIVDAVRSLTSEKKIGKELTILGYEVWTPIAAVTHCLNIDTFIMKKLEALAEHRSQHVSMNLSDAIKALNRYRGIMYDKPLYAECFEEIAVS